MGFDGSNGKNNEMWDWREEDYALQTNLELDVSQYLLDDMSQNNNSLLYMFGDQTPVKDCGDFGFNVLDIGDNANKGSKEYRECSQLKRRRVLQFTADVDDTNASNEHASSLISDQSKVRKEFVEVGLSECPQWNHQWSLDLSDGRYAINNEGFDKSSLGLLGSCSNESEMHYSSDEMSSCRNDSFTSDEQVDVSEFCNISPEFEVAKTVVVRKKKSPSPCRIIKGRKSFMKTPTKLSSTVVYPFALIKPCGAQGDVTLKDINQRIHVPPSSRSKQKDEDPSVCYPISALTGKPVVVKTKICTQGGKGSITISRTRG